MKKLCSLIFITVYILLMVTTIPQWEYNPLSTHEHYEETKKY